MTRLVLGVDSSTQSTKVEARDAATGVVVAKASSPHPPTTPPISEQDPRSWWQALTLACEQLGDLRNDVAAVSVAGQQHGLVLLDESDAPIRPAKLWNDTTSADQAAALVARFGADRLAALTGSVPVAAFTSTKLAWVAEHEPESLGRTRRVMLPHDYLTWCLTGAHVTDRGDASGTGWYDAARGAYVNELLAHLASTDTDLSTLLPKVLGPTETAGTLQPQAATTLGLPKGTLVGPGTGDNMAGALGLALQAGDVVISLGTSGVAYAVSDQPTHDASGCVAGFADASGRFLPLVCTLNATKVTDTISRWLGTDAPGLAALAIDADHRRVGPVVVPYFDGERTPNRPDATGGLVGLTNDTTREDLALAAHDGVLCGLFDGVDALRSAGVTIDGELFLTGGGARSAAYQQRCADLWERPITIPDADETVATGAAVQAAAIAQGTSLGEIQQSWKLGRGEHVDPRADCDAASIRERYRTATASS